MKRLPRPANAALCLGLSFLLPAAPVAAQVVEVAAPRAGGVPAVSASGFGLTAGPGALGGAGLSLAGGVSLSPSVRVQLTRFAAPMTAGALTPLAGASLAPLAARTSAPQAASAAGPSSADLPGAPALTERSRQVFSNGLRSLAVSAGPDAAGAARMAPEKARATASTFFDRMLAERAARVEAKSAAATAPAEKPSRWSIPLLSRWRASRAAAAPKVAAAPALDEYSGPRAEGSFTGTVWSLRHNVFYGIKWGLLMIGMLGALTFAYRFLEVGAILLLGGAPTPTIIGGLDPAVVRNFGEALTDRPWSFLFQDQLAQVVWEELKNRVLLFGAMFMALAQGWRPILRFVTNLVAGKKDHGVRRFLGRQLFRLDFLTRRAFPIAALASAAVFAWTHVAMWGSDPWRLTVLGIFGTAMAWVFYRTRNPVAPIVAHWVYDALQFLAAIFLLHFAFPPLYSDVYLKVLYAMGAGFLWYHARAALRARRAAKRGAVLQ